MTEPKKTNPTDAQLSEEELKDVAGGAGAQKYSSRQVGLINDDDGSVDSLEQVRLENLDERDKK